jgi:NADP-dependent 3-hydroxy acid dehydrogenase YdfG
LNKTAPSGATSGIEKQHPNLVENNYRAILCGRREDRLIELKIKCSTEVHCLPV